MKWPFASRLAFNLMRESRDSWQAMAVAANARAATAEARYHAAMERTQAKPVTMPERKRDELTEVIALKAGNDPALRRHLGAWAAQQRRAKVDETVIANEILHWKGDEETDEVVS